VDTLSEDSTVATIVHARRVDELLMQQIAALSDRVTQHDRSKLDPAEKDTFDEYSPKLKASTYGSDEYKGFLAEMQVALDHHYATNRHHPEHFANGVDGMTLVDLVEMLCDWKAAGERHANGSMARSLEVQKDRFHLSDQLLSILTNTAREAGWL
jgi:Family of unknown function (DUF5662)